MSKKKNKKSFKDIWDITAEEQMQSAEEFRRYENGEVDIFSISSGRTIPGFTDDGLPYDVINKMQNIYGIYGKQNTVVEPENDNVNPVNASIPYTGIADIIEKTNEKENLVPEIENITQQDLPITNDNSIKGVFFDYLKELGLMTINDTIGSRIHNLNNISAYCELYPVESEMDASDIADIASQIYYLIISTTYPVCVMDKDVFEKEFSIFDSIDNSQYLFFQSSGYISAYYISPEEREKFFYIIEETLKEDNVIPFYMSLLTACDTVNNAYMHENTEFVKKWKGITDSNIERFISKITSDETTTYAVGSYPKEQSTKKRMRVINESKLRIRVYDFADEIQPSKDSSDEEEDENFIYEKDFLESSKVTEAELIRKMEDSLFNTPAVEPVEEEEIEEPVELDSSSSEKLERNTKFNYPGNDTLVKTEYSSENTSDMTVSVMRRNND